MNEKTGHETNEFKEFSEKIKSGELDEKIIDEYAKKIAENISKSIKNHQIRKIYDFIRRAETEKDLVLTKAKIAYQNRVIQRNEFIGLYLDFIDLVIKEPEKREYLDQFNEAVVCYFKYFNARG